MLGSKSTKPSYGNDKISLAAIADVKIEILGGQQEARYVEVIKSVTQLKNAETPITKNPRRLSPTAKYRFYDKTLILGFSHPTLNWQLLEISGFYDFTAEKLMQKDFLKVDICFVPTSQLSGRAQFFKIDLSKVDRHVLMKRFTFQLRYKFNDSPMVHSNDFYANIPYFQTKTPVDNETLKNYFPSEEIVNLHNAKFKMTSSLTAHEAGLLRELIDCGDKDVGKLSRSQIMQYALNIEDLATQDKLSPFALRDVVLKDVVDRSLLRTLCKHNPDERYLSFVVAKAMLPPDFEDYSLSFMPMTKFVDGVLNLDETLVFASIEKSVKINNEDHGSNVKYEIFVQNRYEMKEVNSYLYHPFIKRKTKCFLLKANEKYLVRFVPNRITSRAALNAYSTINENGLEDFFDEFNFKPAKSFEKSQIIHVNFNWFNSQIRANEEQKMAIRNIVNCTAFPFPYIVFGPPGTGKTSLIVEAVAQILTLKPNSRILITAQSNSACDEIGTRLLKYVSTNKIYRWYSQSSLDPRKDKTDPKLKKTSNLRNKKNERLTLEEFLHFKVIIATLLTSSRIIQQDIEKLNLHFDYIFVDECAAATEPEALVPIAGLATGDKAITSNIVLLGDHKQLGPINTSEFASRLGLERSLMERLMTKTLYLQGADKSFNSKYVTQLLDNFRSHPAILHFSNEMFYDSKLRAKAAEDVQTWAYDWSCLTNKTFPILFDCVTSPSFIQKGGTSSLNYGELDKVRYYVDLLLKDGINGKEVVESDIGIVSPYKAQHHLLKNNLKCFPQIEIGSAEYYQGREKKIIIFSTVKSRTGIGFLNSEKRLNVCITRAKSLLILIGNADTLQKCHLWSRFLEYLKDNNACCGKPFKIKHPHNESVISTEEQACDGRASALLAMMVRLKNLKMIFPPTP